MLINCDIGERGVAHKIDDQLMEHIDIANIACGGHAGSEQSVQHYYELAKKRGIKASVHLSYPDPKNFGRAVMDIDDTALLNSLDQQYELLNEVKTLKLHGALYNEANINPHLARLLMNWAKSVGIKAVLTPQNSEVAKCSGSIEVISEVFLDRQYVYVDNHLSLKNRKEPNALITDIGEVCRQYQSFSQNFIMVNGIKHQIRVDTACIHSDSDNALELIRAIKSV
ncbi:MAG: LamB/YcsF family protein [Gammaproteobacteria bacterium]|nr:LamB/YcsF family protein [Gammaproteobacteria bacterium]